MPLQKWNPKGHVFREQNFNALVAAMRPSKVEYQGTCIQGTEFHHPVPKVLSKTCFTLKELVTMQSCRSIQVHNMLTNCASQGACMQGTEFHHPAPKVSSKTCFTLNELVTMQSCRSIQVHNMLPNSAPQGTCIQETTFHYAAPKVSFKTRFTLKESATCKAVKDSTPPLGVRLLLLEHGKTLGDNSSQADQPARYSS